MLENILLWGILGYLVWRLLGMKRQVKTQEVVRGRPEETLEGLFFPPELGVIRDMPEIAFLALVKVRFAQITMAFAHENLKCVKNFITQKVYSALQKAIEERQKADCVMDYKLIDFKSVKTSDMGNDSVRWIEFETEQVNLLKNKEGKVVEGNEMSLSMVKEKWQFVFQEKEGWLLSAIETVDFHAI